METSDPILTTEEHAVLVLAALHPNLKHLGINEIGERLGISITKVKTLIHQACEKLGADNRNEAVLFAVKRGEIKLDELISLEELAEILRALDSNVLRMISSYVRLGQQDRVLPENYPQLTRVERRRSGVLTNRERDVLILASYGMTNNEIAEKLFMSVSAVRTFLNRAFTKLGASKKADAVQLALKHGEIGVDEISSFNELADFLTPLGAESIDRLASLLNEKRIKNPIPSVV